MRFLRVPQVNQVLVCPISPSENLDQLLIIYRQVNPGQDSMEPLAPPAAGVRYTRHIRHRKNHNGNADQEGHERHGDPEGWRGKEGR